MQREPGDITLLLNQWKDGNSGAFDRLVPLVYPRLRELAASYIRRERDPGFMQATSLVHELYMRLVQQKKTEWGDRSHFFAFSAKIMRIILIDHARTNQARKHGGGVEHIPLNEDIPWVSIGSPEMLALNQALDALSALDEKKVQLVELRYFLGCTAEETASHMNVSKATVDRDLKFVRTWLYRRIGNGAAL